MNQLTVSIRKDFDGHISEYLEYRDCLFKSAEKKINSPVKWEFLKEEGLYFVYAAVIEKKRKRKLYLYV